MRILSTATLCVALAVVMSGTSPGMAQSGPQTYPYCALDSSSGATSCYYNSRAACGARCIDNPSYVGSNGAMASGGSRRLRRR